MLVVLMNTTLYYIQAKVHLKARIHYMTSAQISSPIYSLDQLALAAESQRQSADLNLKDIKVQMVTAF